MIAKIAVSDVSFAADKPYSYRIPQGMEVKPGHRVQIPFGRGDRTAQGVVLSVEEQDPQASKELLSCLDEAPILTETQLRLAAFLRERCFCTFFEAVRSMLPAGLWFQAKIDYTLTPDRTWQEKTIRKAGAKQILSLMEALGGCADEGALDKLELSGEVLDAALTYLLHKKWIQGQTRLLRRTTDKTEQIATLLASAEEVQEYLAKLPRNATHQRSALELLANMGSVSVKELRYYTGAGLEAVKRLEQLGYVALSHRSVLRCRELQPVALPGPLVLNREQQQCLEGLSHQLQQEQPGVALLYGVTGSGKTSVYIQLIRQCLSMGRSALLLVPEIALTPQLLGLMAAHFDREVAVLHSSLSPGERQDQWKRARSGEATVIVGTRSAVFAPCANPGVIILDEEQEHSYKSENSPRYHAREVAMWRGVKEKALVVLGSATPSVESMYRAKTGQYSLYRLSCRYGGRPLPEVELVDMAEELRQGNDLSLSRPLQQAILDTWKQGKQTILLLNRRGNSRALVCVDCRESPECPRCSQRLTYHSANNRLMCHYCGHSQSLPKRCPSCGGPMKTMGVGTQKVQQELNMLFPDMEVSRMDADTISAVNTHEKVLQRFREENIPVLVGTQMVAKGLNLPQVTLVGVLDGDLSLYTGGFRAGETTFDMLTQVVGRAGRGDSPGRALIQTMVPDHLVLTLAARQDYDGFYEQEIRLRQALKAPPFADEIIVTFLGRENGHVLRSAAAFRDGLLACLAEPGYRDTPCTLLGPAPCVVPKINYNYRHQLTLRGKLNRKLRLLLQSLLHQFARDKQNRGVTAFADVNGYD